MGGGRGVTLFNDDQRAASKTSGRRYAIFFRLASATPIRLWSGFGDFPMPEDAVETTDGAIYKGLSELPNLPAIDALVNGRASRLDFTLSAPDPDGSLRDAADSDAVAVRFKAVRLGLWPLGADWAPVGPMRWIWRGTADQTRLNHNRADPLQPVTAMTLSVSSLFAGRRQQKASFWTPEDQALDAPNDTAFDQVALLSEGVEKKWPKG